MDLPLLWLSGPSGVGKSSVGWEVFARLSRDGVTTAFVDGDQIGMCHPLPENGAHALRARNLAAMLPHFRQEGVRCLVLSGFVDTAEEVAEYTSRMPGVAFTSCRLRVGGAELRRRFLARGWRPDLVEDAVAEAAGLERSTYADLCVDTGGLGVAEAARLVRERAAGGWPGVLPAVTPHEVAAPVDSGTAPVLWFAGATASGKSTIAYEIFREVFRSGTPAAYVDVKQIGVLRPIGDDLRLKARNLAAVWAGYREAGAECLIVSGEADSDDTIRRYAELLPKAPLTVCRLHAGPATLAERVARRGRGEGPALPGDEMNNRDMGALRRIAERAAAEALTGGEGLRIDTDGLQVHEVVALVRDRIGDWPTTRP